MIFYDQLVLLLVVTTVEPPILGFERKVPDVLAVLLATVAMTVYAPVTRTPM